MNITLRIARNELAALFYSPIAWFILVAFSFFCAKCYCSLVEGDLSYYSLNDTHGASLTQALFMGQQSVWNDIVDSLYIYIPLLTMGLVSREMSSGSIKLLYSSPVTSVQIVAGKYLAAVTFGTCLLTVPVLEILVSGLVYVPHFDWAPVLVGLLGVVLLMCTYCAIGLFMSALTSYQVVAAIGTLAVLAALRFASHVGQEYEWMREFTYWLSLGGRTEKFIAGIVDSADVIYFILVSGMFLSLATLRIWYSRKSTPRTLKAAAYGTVVALTLLAGYATSRPSAIAVWDATRTKSNSLAAQSLEVLSLIDGPLTVTSYVNLLDSKSGPYMPRNIKMNEALLAPYRLAKPDLRERYVYYYDETPGNALARKPKYQGMSLEEMRDYMVLINDVNPLLFMPPGRIRAMQDLSGEDNCFVRLVETASGRKAWLRDFSDMQRTPGEAEITAVLKKMTQPVPLVAFIRAAGSREVSRPGDRDYGAFSIERYSRAALVNQGFDVIEVNLDAGEAIPDSTSIIVLGDPRAHLAPDALASIDSYLDRGGNMMLLTDTGRQDEVAPLLARWGLAAAPGQLVEKHDDFAPDFILARGAAASPAMPGGVARHFAKGHMRVSMPGCVALDTLPCPHGLQRTVWMQSSPESWVELEEAHPAQAAAPVCNPAAGESTGPRPVMVALERECNGKAQRILIAGDADCFSNAELQISREGYISGNFDLLMECFRYLSHGAFPVEVTRRPNDDTAFSPRAASLQPLVKAMLMFVVPGLMILLGTGLHIMRRRK